MQAVNADDADVQRALSDKIAAYRDLYNLQVADAERVRNEKCDKARAEMMRITEMNDTIFFMFHSSEIFI